MPIFRYAWRALQSAKWYSLTIIGVIGLGMALATTVFAIVDGVLFKPLPYPASDELFFAGGVSTADRQTRMPVSAPMLRDWRAAVPQERFDVTVIPGPYDSASLESLEESLGRAERPAAGYGRQATGGRLRATDARRQATGWHIMPTP